MSSLKKRKLRLDRTLGPLVIQWIEDNLCHGPGDVQGQPIVHDDEEVEFIMRAYEIDDKGGRVVRRAVLSRAKGRRKSEIAAEIVCAEALGPVRFAGWDHDGRPLGMNVQNPIIRVVATEENQSDNAYVPVQYMLTEGPIADRVAGVDVGMTRTLLPGGGKIAPITAKASSKDGGRETFVVFDEALDVNTPLPTPEGWKLMRDIQEGDRVFGPDGNPTEVVKATDVQDDRRCFQLVFRDGTSVVTSEGHLWETKRGVISTSEMREGDSIPWTVTCHNQEKDLPLDPYTFGYWLGDGDSRNATISVGEEDLRETSRHLVAAGHTVKNCSTARAPLIYVSLPGSHRNRFSPVKGVKTRLRDMGVLGDKHIPSDYLRASVSQRISLLQGLMDSDGHVTKSGHCTFSNSNRTLIDATVELLRSLGQRATVSFQADARSRVGGCWKINFTPYGLQPFHLERKRVRVYERDAPKWNRVCSVAEVDSVPVRCIAVAHPRHLFVAGRGWKLTHNTHLYNKPELRNLHATLRRNLAKRKAAQPWSLETSTMYAPGEDSVAEGSHRYYEAILAGSVKDPGFLFDHKQGPSKFDFDDDEQLRAALVEAYGAAAEWMDVERLIMEARDPQTDKGDFLRYFVNIPSERYEGKWISDEAWRACQVDTEIPAGAEIVVAVDAAHSRDTSALVWTWISPNGRLIQRSRVWSCLPNKPHDVLVPGGRLDNDLLRDYIIDTLCGDYTVVLALGDPMDFNDQLREIAEAGVTVFEMVQGAADMREAWDEFYGHIYSGRRPRLGAPGLSAPGGEIYSKHIRNAVGVKTERGWRVSKKTAISPIDCVAAGAMSAWGSERIEELAYVSGGVVF